MRKTTKFFMMLVASAGLAATITACGDDEPRQPESVDNAQTGEDDSSEIESSDLWGYWINSDNTGAMHISRHTSGQSKVVYFVYSEQYPQKYADWESYYTDGGSFTALSLSGTAVSVKISSSSYNKIVLKNNGNSGSLSSYVFSRVDEDAFYAYLQNGGENTPEPGISEASLLGIWRFAGTVFHFREGGACDLYLLESTTSNFYTETNSGTWSLDATTRILTVKSQFFSNYSHSDQWTITEVSSDIIKTDRLDFTRESSLPQKVSSAQSGLLAGTNWSARIDGDYVELSFKTNGTFTETYAGDVSTSTYTELDSNTIIIGDGTVMSNTFGENPFRFELNANKTKLTFSGSGEVWSFSRKQ